MSPTALATGFPTAERLRGILERFNAVYNELDELQVEFGRILDDEQQELEEEVIDSLPPVTAESIVEMVRFCDRFSLNLTFLNEWAEEMLAWPVNMICISERQTDAD